VRPAPLQATEDLLCKLEKAHQCTQQLRGKASLAPKSQSAGDGKGFVLVPAYVPVGLDAPVPAAATAAAAATGGKKAHHYPHHFGQDEAAAAAAAGEGVHHSAATAAAHAHAQAPDPGLQQHLEDLITQHFQFRLCRLPSTVRGAGMGLFLSSGKVQEGAVLTLYPGLIYRVPFDVDAASGYDPISMTPCPPGR